MKIEIIPFLAGIVEENTQLYRIDFAHDEKLLRAAMLESRQEYRTFLWMSRCSGTQCVLEREVFMQESRGTFHLDILCQPSQGNQGLPRHCCPRTTRQCCVGNHPTSEIWGTGGTCEAERHPYTDSRPTLQGWNDLLHAP